MTHAKDAVAPRSYSIGEVSQQTGLSAHALRFYEREGLLLHPLQRSSDGRRSYSDADLEWLDVCIKLRSSGMPLADIRRYAQLVREGPGNEQQRLEVLKHHQQRLAAQMGQLINCQELVSLKVQLYQQSITNGAPDPICPSTS